MTCNTNYYLLGTGCTQTCGAGHYTALNTQNQQICSGCVSPCQDCTGSSTCTSCISALPLLFVGGTGCGTSCPFGQYQSSSTTCSSCPTSCATCSSSTICTSCPSTSTHTQTYLYTDGSCYNPCPLTTYANVVNGAYLCSPCPTGCALCSYSGTNFVCTQCTSVATINFYLYGTQCLQICPPTYYGGSVSSMPQCVQCVSPCATCNTSTSCLSCLTGHQLIYGSTTCSSSCPTSQYQDTATTCALCDPNCATCQTSATYCLTCTSAYLYTTDHKCYASCPSGTYLDANSECTDCTTGCAACSLVNSVVQCSLCTSVSGVQYYLLNNACTSNCGGGYYGGFNTNSQPVCNNCSLPCGNCLSNTSCLTCTSGLLVFGGTSCPASCPDGQYASSSNACSLCNSNCLTCVTSPTNCLTCGTQSGVQTYLNTSDNKCYINCPSATFKNSVNNQCTACDSSCSGCIDISTYCVACATNYFRVIGSQACTQNCGDGYYGDSATYTCTACPVGCAKCSMNGTTLNCTQCNSFAGVQYYLQNISCVSLCPAGTF